MLSWIRSIGKPVDELSFKDYLSKLRREGKSDSDREVITNLSETVPLLLINRFPHLGMREVDRMEWREVKYRIKLIERESMRMAEDTKRLLESLSSSNDERWDYEILNDMM